MKNSNLLLILILMPFFGFSQINIDEIPKKSNAVEVINDLSYEENFTAIGKIVIENNLTIAQKDKEFGFITTEPKSIGNNVFGATKYTIKVKEKNILISGVIQGGGINVEGVSLNGSFPVENKGRKGSPLKNSFELMVKLAEQMPHTKINFLILE